MTDPAPYRVKVRPEVTGSSAELVRTYDSTYGACSPGCCPEALAAVIERLANDADLSISNLHRIAAQLRGEQP